MTTGHDHAWEGPSGVRLLDLDDAADKARLDALMRACEEADGHLPFGDHELLAIAAGATEGHVGLAIDDGGPQDALEGYAHLSSVGDDWMTEIAVHPDRRNRGLGSRLLDAVTAHVAAHGGGTLSTWAFHMDGATMGIVRRGGFHPVRTLLQMRLDPMPESAPPLSGDLTLDAFRPGEDEPDWLALNARAFAHLPDQGSWTRHDLALRMAAPWFRAEDMLVLRRGGTMIGTCWCKLDPDRRAGDGRLLGEIYVVALEPAAAGGGLGKKLTLHGLVHLRRRGAEVGMLYVDGANERAIAMYRSLGFTVHHDDVCLATRVAPASASA